MLPPHTQTCDPNRHLLQAPWAAKKARSEQSGKGFAQSRTRSQSHAKIFEGFPGTAPPPCPPGGTLLIKPLQKAEGRGLERPEPPRSCCPGRLLGPEPRANAFQEGIRIFLCDVEGEIDSIASEHGAKRRERTAPSGKRRPSRPGSAKHLQFN